MAESTETEREAPSNGGQSQHSSDRADKSAGDRPAQSPGQAPEINGGDEPTPKKRSPIIYVVAAVVVVLALFFGIRFWLYNRVHVSTDDAYVTGDLVNVSPLISGTLTELTVQEGDFVKRGQLIGRIDPSGAEASLRQAQANLNAALTQVPQAQQNLAYQQLSTKAAIMKAQAALESQRSKTTGAQQQVTLTSATVRNQIEQAKAQVDAAQAQAQQAKAQVKSAAANRDSFVQAVQTARLGLSNSEQQIVSAQRAAQAAQARTASAKAEADRSTRDEARYRNLYDQDAVSAQQYDNARAQALTDQSAYQAAVSDAQQAESQVESARRAALQSRSSVVQARKNADQAQAQVSAAQKAADAYGEQVTVAQAGLGLAQANATQVGIQQSNLLSTTQQTGESEADVETAKAGQEQIDVRQKQIATYRAQAAQARAALTNAQITLQDTYILSPTDGEVVRKDSNIGTSMSPGSTIVTVSQGDYVWIVANFKETQLQDVRVGQPAEITIDAFPGKTFKGRVRSITAATGAATSLLPPDNATGNFTKVVQRIPVRIELVAASEGADQRFATKEDIRNLRQGMSVNATIDTSNKDNQAPTQLNAGYGAIQGQGNPNGTPAGTGGSTLGVPEPGAPANPATGPDRGVLPNQTNGTASQTTPIGPGPNGLKAPPPTNQPGQSNGPNTPSQGSNGARPSTSPSTSNSPAPSSGTSGSPNAVPTNPQAQSTATGSPQSGQSTGTSSSQAPLTGGSSSTAQAPAGSPAPSGGSVGGH